MERESTTHSRRIDEALEHRVESLTRGAPDEARVREDRMEEDPGDGVTINPAARPDLDPPGPLTQEELDERAELARWVADVGFPTDRERLVATALDRSAPPEVLERLNGLPHGRPFENLQAVWRASGGPVEDGHF
jgi:hypothetical protein